MVVAPNPLRGVLAYLVEVSPIVLRQPLVTDRSAGAGLN